MKKESQLDTTLFKNQTDKNIFSSNKKRVEFLETQIQELSILCQTLDPYKKIPVRQKKVLKRYNVINLNDPFMITNKLLLLIEDSIEELETLKQRTNI